MKIEMDVSEIWDLLKQGSTNQREFINSLRFSEFKEFIEIIEDYEEIDLRGYINGGILWVEDDPLDEYVIWENGRKKICMV